MKSSFTADRSLVETTAKDSAANFKRRDQRVPSSPARDPLRMACLFGSSTHRLGIRSVYQQEWDQWARVYRQGSDSFYEGKWSSKVIASSLHRRWLSGINKDKKFETMGRQGLSQMDDVTVVFKKNRWSQIRTGLISLRSRHSFGRSIVKELCGSRFNIPHPQAVVTTNAPFVFSAFMVFRTRARDFGTAGPLLRSPVRYCAHPRDFRWRYGLRNDVIWTLENMIDSGTMSWQWGADIVSPETVQEGCQLW